MWNPFKKKSVVRHAPNPYQSMTPKQSRSFFSGDSGRYFSGWTSQSNSIDYYLKSELTELRARSREIVRRNPLGRRLVDLMKSNILGPHGISVQAHTVRFTQGREELDTRANDAIEAALKDWGRNHADKKGKKSFLALQNTAISNAVQDGEFIFREHFGVGKYGYQLESIDPELLDTQKNELTLGGGEIRLGVEYNKAGEIVRYWFKERNYNGDYHSGKTYSIDARYIIHGFISDWPDQSRGVPWTHAGLERAKHLDKFRESLIVRARASANVFIGLTSTDSDTYSGSEDDPSDDSRTYDPIEPGEIKDFRNREIHSIDPNYPDQAVDIFIKSQVRDIAMAWNVTYQSLSGDLSDTSFSSGRTGIQEEREMYKARQEWLIDNLIRRVYENWLVSAYMKGELKIGTAKLARPVADYMPANFQARRWQWVDPAKDAAANEMAINQRLKSRSQIMRENGDDPQSVWNEIEREIKYMEDKNIAPQSADAAMNALSNQQDDAKSN